MVWLRAALKGRLGFVAGFLCASLLFGGFAGAAEIIQKEIQVSYLPLRYFFDGVEKYPPADQKGFTLNGRTYVPLRFMSDSVSKAVEYDANTFSIYVGRRQSPVPEFWEQFNMSGSGSLTKEYYQKGAMTNRNIPVSDALILSAKALAHTGEQKDERFLALSRTVTLQPGQKAITGSFFVPEQYIGQLEHRKIAEITVRDITNVMTIWQGVVYSEGEHIAPFRIPVEGYQSVRLYIHLHYGDGLVGADGFVSTHLGIAQFAVQ